MKTLFILLFMLTVNVQATNHIKAPDPKIVAIFDKALGIEKKVWALKSGKVIRIITPVTVPGMKIPKCP